MFSLQNELKIHFLTRIVQFSTIALANIMFASLHFVDVLSTTSFRLQRTATGPFHVSRSVAAIPPLSVSVYYQQLMAWKKHLPMPLRLRIIELSISDCTPRLCASSIMLSMNRSINMSVRSSRSPNYKQAKRGITSKFAR